MRGGEPGAVFVATADQVLDLGVFLLGASRPAAGLLGRGGQPVQLFLGGGAAAVGGADLLPQPGNPVGAGRDGASPLGEAAFGGGQFCFGGTALGDGGGQYLTAGRQPLGQRLR